MEIALLLAGLLIGYLLFKRREDKKHVENRSTLAEEAKAADRRSPDDARQRLRDRAARTK